jgi:hypothetical protein
LKPILAELRPLLRRSRLLHGGKSREGIARSGRAAEQAHVKILQGLILKWSKWSKCEGQDCLCSPISREKAPPVVEI